MKLKENAGKLLIAAGCALIFGAFLLRAVGVYRQNQLLEQYARYVTAEAIPASDDASNAANKPDTPQGALGVLSISKLGLKVPLAEGIDHHTLRDAVGHFTGTALPGELGNVCIAGHSSGVSEPHFQNLNQLAAGDSIEIQTAAGTYSYRISQILTVNPDEVWVLDASEKAELTLVTCTPPLFPTHRLIVKAEAVETGSL